MELLKHAAITLCFSTSSTELSSRWLEFGMHNLMCWDGTIARSLSWSETAAEFAVCQPTEVILPPNKQKRCSGDYHQAKGRIPETCNYQHG